MFKGKMRIKLGLPKFKLQPQLEQIALKIIKPDIQQRMDKGIGIDDTPHKKNTNSTRINKGLRGLRTDVPLIASGQLRRSFITELVGDDAVRISPRGMRNPYPNIKRKYRLQGKAPKRKKSEDLITNRNLADILQNRGVGRSGHTYNFFGISDLAEAKSIKWMHRYIKKVIKDGGRKIIR